MKNIHSLLCSFKEYLPKRFFSNALSFLLLSILMIAICISAYHIPIYPNELSNENSFKTLVLWVIATIYLILLSYPIRFITNCFYKLGIVLIMLIFMITTLSIMLILLDRKNEHIVASVVSYKHKSTSETINRLRNGFVNDSIINEELVRVSSITNNLSFYRIIDTAKIEMSDWLFVDTSETINYSSWQQLNVKTGLHYSFKYKGRYIKNIMFKGDVDTTVYNLTTENFNLYSFNCDSTSNHIIYLGSNTDRIDFKSLSLDECDLFISDSKGRELVKVTQDLKIIQYKVDKGYTVIAYKIRSTNEDVNDTTYVSSIDHKSKEIRNILSFL